jgi:transketolase
MDSETKIQLNGICRDVRRDIINMIHTAGSGHPGGSLSAVEILVVLYFHYMNIDPKKPKWAHRDKFILSKGHAAPLVYAILAERGFFPKQQLSTFNAPGTSLQKHIDMHLVPGAELSTGSLGQGLSAGLGMALCDRLDKKTCRTFVLLGDGEVQEGQVWEAAMAASQYHTGNLICFLDNNGCQVDGYTGDICMIEPISEKWVAFGWEVQRINGHDISEIEAALKSTQAEKNKPHMIIADTVKGKGISFMENKPEWHAKSLSEDEYATATRELNDKEGGKAND